LLGSPFGVSSLVAHRFDLRNLVRGLALAVRVGIVAACFLIWPGSLWHVGVGTRRLRPGGLACDVLVWRRLTPELGSARERRIPGRSRPGAPRHWSAVNTAGMLLLMQVDLVIVNAVFGAEATGRYGSILLMVALVHAGAESRHPDGELGRHGLLRGRGPGGPPAARRRSIKLLGVGLALPIGLLCGLGEPLLALWLGPAFADLHVVLALLVAHLTSTSPCGPSPSS
jgi:membrane protein EpsK